MNYPFFSIIIPTYNRGDLIRNSIDSVLKQEYKSFEVIVVDDGGTDNTEEIIKELNHSQVRYVRQQNQERGAARNNGVQHSKGAYVTFLDSDDVLLTHALGYAYEQLERLGWPFCYAQAHEFEDINTNKVTPQPQIVSSGLINSSLLRGNLLSCIGVFIKKEVFSCVKFEEERMFAGTEDWLLWLQIAARFPFHYDSRVCARMQQHDSRSVMSFSEEKLRFRSEFIRLKLKNDQTFFEKFGESGITNVYTHMLTYSALHLVMGGKLRAGLRYLAKAIKLDFKIVFQRRTIGIIKLLVGNLWKKRLYDK